MQTVEKVDLQQFMGDWFVIASIPTIFDKAPCNAVEQYELNADGSIATTYTYRSGTSDGPRKQMRSRAFVRDTETNAEWGMQFIWPVRADYRIVYLDEAYEHAVVARTKLDYVWIMARTPQIAEDRLTEILGFVERLGYDMSKIRMVPQDEGQAQAADQA